ncbi:MAG: rhamnan synthesis F family protein [Pseudomonadota bacterium]
MAGTPQFFKKLAHRVKLLSRLIRVGRVAWSGLFDRDQYRENYPGLSALWKRFPICHYVLIGERMGYAPFETFDPVSYADMYEDVADYPHGALMHYIRHGHAESRFTQSPLDAAVYFEGAFPAVTPWPKSARFAVVVHVFYLEVWDKFAAHLAAIELDLDVIVTLPDTPDFDHSADAIAQGPLHVAHIQRQPNVGRDILAFLNLVNSGALSRYEAVCKLHTKKSPHLVDGDVWRQELLNGLLPMQGATKLAEAFVADPGAQMLVPDPFLYRGDKWWSINKPVAEHLVEGMDLTLGHHELEFAAGSMFWLKPKLLEEIRSLGFRADQFVLERGQLDGTTAHAFERLTGILCARTGGRIAVTSEMTGPVPQGQSGRPSDFKMITGSTR